MKREEKIAQAPYAKRSRESSNQTAYKGRTISHSGIKGITNLAEKRATCHDRLANWVEDANWSQRKARVRKGKSRVGPS